MAWLVAAAVFFVSIVGLLAARVTIVVDVHRRKSLHARARVQALWGLVDVHWPRSGPPKPHEHKPPRRPGAGRPGAERRRARRKPSARASLRRARAALGARGVAPSFARYLSRLSRALHPDEFTASFRFGLGDPADTGSAWGALAPLYVAVASYCPELRVAPAFDEACFDVDARGRVSVVPLELLLLTLAFVLSPAMLRAARAAWSAE